MEASIVHLKLLQERSIHLQRIVQLLYRRVLISPHPKSINSKQITTHSTLSKIHTSDHTQPKAKALRDSDAHLLHRLKLLVLTSDLTLTSNKDQLDRSPNRGHIHILDKLRTILPTWLAAGQVLIEVIAHKLSADYNFIMYSVYRLMLLSIVNRVFLLM